MSPNSILESRPATPSRDVFPQVTGWRSRLSHPSVFLAVILSAQLMVVLDTTIVNVALPHMEKGLHFSGSSLSWVLNAYLLTFGGLLLLGARAGGQQIHLLWIEHRSDNGIGSAGTVVVGQPSGLHFADLKP